MKKLCVSLMAVLALVVSLHAEDKKPAPKLSGTWTKSADGGVEITIEFKGKNQALVTVEAGDNSVTTESTYTVEKDGTIKAEIVKVSSKGNVPEKLGKGLKFSCKFEIKEKTAKLTDFTVDGLDGAKEVMEGEYKAKK